MSSPADMPFTLVVAADFGSAGGFAFDRAAHVARRIAGSDLHIVHVVEKEATAEEAAQIGSKLKLDLEEKLRQVPGLEQQTIALHVRHGKAAHEIAQLARDVQADLIVVGAEHGGHLKHLILGSVAETLLLDAPCPVFVAGPEPTSKNGEPPPAVEPLYSTRDSQVGREANEVISQRSAI